MEATTKQIRQVRALIMDGISHADIANQMGITTHKVNCIMSHIRSNDIELNFQVPVEQVQKVHNQLFEAIEEWQRNPTLCNLDRMNNLQAIDRRTFAY